MTTTDPGADKAVQALLGAVMDALHEAGYHRDDDFFVKQVDDNEAEVLHEDTLRFIIRAALTHRQQGVVGQMRDALESIRAHCAVQPSALAKAIVATCDAALASAPPAQPQSEDLRRFIGDPVKGLGLSALAATPPSLQEPQEAVAGRFSSADRLIKSLHAERVYIVPTGEVHEGHETLTRHDSPPPLADFETLYASPPRAVEPMPALTDAEVTAMVDGLIRSVAFNRGVAVEISIRVIRAYEAARGIGKQGQG